MKVAIAHQDRATVERLSRWVQEQPDITLGWTAHNAVDVLSKCASHPVHLLLMGLDLPGMPAGRLTGQLMAESPCSILLLNQGCEPCFNHVFDALGQGAADAAILPSPAHWDQPESWDDLHNRLNTLRTLTGHRPRPAGPSDKAMTERLLHRVLPPVVAIGSSTGGPKALATVLSRLPADFPATVVIVQHLDFHFIEGLAEWLNHSTPLPVAALTRETMLQPGKIWLAGRAEHVIINHARDLGWTQEWPELISRPSIDVFFKSLAQHPSIRGCGVLLTGMGRDGAAGLLALRKAGFHTIAQDEASCVVYGMPKAAAELGAAAAVLPLADIGDAIVERIARLHPVVPVS
jgi:two-component system response regulator WspF